MLESMFKGWIGELKTKAAEKLLLDSSVYHVFNNILLSVSGRTTQIDHVVVSRYGVFVLETKDKTGWIFGGEKNSQWTQVIFHARIRFQNPLRQNYLHTKSLSEFLGITHDKIHSLIVFWGDCEFKTPMPDNVVKGIFKPTNFIKSKTLVLFTDQEVETLCQKLKTAKDTTTLSRQFNHAYSLQVRYDNNSVCPQCGGRLVERTSTRGTRVGEEFLGCENYPRCRYTTELE